MAVRGSAGAEACCWPRIAVSATVAEPSITTKPAMPIAKPSAPVPLITPPMSMAMPSTKTTPATIARRRAERRSEVPRRVEANFGSSSTRARSICSSSRSSSSESGTVFLHRGPGAQGARRVDVSQV